ncbi:MAG: radical SAM protein [Patescibacteria group bacterium]|jgi:hypothetical protein
MKKLSEDKIIDLKLDLLMQGVDCDFNNLKTKRDIDSYRVNKIRVSDRHFINPKSKKRKYIPDEILIGNHNFYQTIAKVYYNRNSNFILTYQKTVDKFLIKDKKKNCYLETEVNFIPLKSFSKRIFTTKEGKKIPENEIVTPISIDRLTINPFDGCSMWLNGNECSFCGASPKRVIGPQQIKPSITTISQYQSIGAWWNSQKETVLEVICDSFQHIKISDFKPHLHFVITTGFLYGFEWDIVIEILSVIKEYFKVGETDSHLSLMPPKNIDKLETVKKLGIKNVAFNLECFDQKVFEAICKGKNFFIGYNNFREKLREAVKIFGRGHVRTNFVLGLEDLKNLIKGCEILAEEGIVSDYTIFFPRPASGIQKKTKDILTKAEVIDFTKNLVKIYQLYDYRPFTCNLSSRTSIANDIYNLL